MSSSKVYRLGNETLQSCGAIFLDAIFMIIQEIGHADLSPTNRKSVSRDQRLKVRFVIKLSDYYELNHACLPSYPPHPPDIPYVEVLMPSISECNYI